MAPSGYFYSGISLTIVGGLLGYFVSWSVAAVAFLLSIKLVLMAIVIRIPRASDGLSGI